MALNVGDKVVITGGRGGYCAKESGVRRNELSRCSYGEFVQRAQWKEVE